MLMEEEDWAEAQGLSSPEGFPLDTGVPFRKLSASWEYLERPPSMSFRASSRDKSLPAAGTCQKTKEGLEPRGKTHPPASKMSSEEMMPEANGDVQGRTHPGGVVTRFLSPRKKTLRGRQMQERESNLLKTKVHT